MKCDHTLCHGKWRHWEPNTTKQIQLLPDNRFPLAQTHSSFILLLLILAYTKVSHVSAKLHFDQFS